MAAEDEGRTEEPSEAKLEKARKEGRVAKSQEISGALVLIFSLLVIIVLSRYIFVQLTEVFTFYFGKIHNPDFSDVGLLIEFYNVMLRCVLPVMFIAAIAGVVANIVQNKGFIFSTKPIEIKFSKIVPRFGEYFKKTIFSGKGLFNVAKSFLKVIVICVIAYLYIRRDMLILTETLQNGNITMTIGKIARMAAEILLTVAVVFLAISIPDYFVQKRDFMNEMKMTKQEVKEEFKEMEGDPEVKGKLKQMQQSLLSQNIPKAVSESDVVIANPEHFAVALKYDVELADAPVVNAKGEDEMAQTIKRIARENDIPIVENRPVARALYTNVELGAIIPQEYVSTLAVIYSQLEKFKNFGSE